MIESHEVLILSLSALCGMWGYQFGEKGSVIPSERAPKWLWATVAAITGYAAITVVFYGLWGPLIAGATVGLLAGLGTATVALATPRGRSVRRFVTMTAGMTALGMISAAFFPFS